MRRSLFIAVGILELGCASLRPLPRVPPESFAGCYDVSHGAWKPTQVLGEDAIFTEPPAHVVLVWDHAQEKAHTAAAVPGTTPSIHTWNAWSISDDEISVGWSTGFSGVVMTLHPAGANLEGSMKTLWDFPRSATVAPVSLRRVPCPAQAIQ